MKTKDKYLTEGLELQEELRVKKIHTELNRRITEAIKERFFYGRTEHLKLLMKNAKKDFQSLEKLLK